MFRKSNLYLSSLLSRISANSNENYRCQALATGSISRNFHWLSSVGDCTLPVAVYHHQLTTLTLLGLKGLTNSKLLVTVNPH